MKCSVHPTFSLFQNLETLKPVYKKFPLIAHDGSASVKIFPKVGKYFIVRYSARSGHVQLIGNPMINERHESGHLAYSNHSLKDLTSTRTDIVSKLKALFRNNVSLGKGSYTFEVLYDQKKKKDQFTFIDIYEFSGNILQTEIYGKRLAYLNQLTFPSSGEVDIHVLTPEADDVKLLHHSEVTEGQYGARGLEETSNKRKTFWIRDLCETIQCRTIYTFKKEGKRDTLGRYAIVGSAVRLERRKHVVRKTDYKDLKEVPKTLTDVIQAFMMEHAATKEDFLQNVQNRASAQLPFINRVKSSDAFKERLQQYERGEIVQDVNVFLVAGSGDCQRHLQIFGFIKADSLAKRGVRLPAACEKTSPSSPGYLSWVKPDEQGTQYKDTKYFDGLLLTDCVQPERYTGSSLSICCQSIKAFIPSHSFLEDDSLKRFVQILPVPKVYKESTIAGTGREKLKRPLAECTDTELVEHVRDRVQAVGRKKAKKEEQNIMGHVDIIGDYLEDGENDGNETSTRRARSPSVSGNSGTTPSSPSSSEDRDDDEEDSIASNESGEEEVEEGEVIECRK